MECVDDGRCKASGPTGCRRSSTPRWARAGGELTEAQAQQVALAGLLLADPSVVILDEATSQMDPGSARPPMRALATVLVDRTGHIAIAHQLHTSHDADRIAVIGDGRNIEIGSHLDLLDQDGAFARLWSRWL